MDKLNTYDPLLFNDDFFHYIRNKNNCVIKDLLLKRQKEERAKKIQISQKKKDLMIWNVTLLKEVRQAGLTLIYLADTFNYFDDEIEDATSLKRLHEVELDLFSRYNDALVAITETTDHLLVNNILHFLHINLEDCFTLREVCDYLDISQSYASRIFRQEMGLSIMNYATFLRVKRAQLLLQTTSDSIATISDRLCFYDQAHFSRTFKHYTSFTPSQFRVTHTKTTQS